MARRRLSQSSQTPDLGLALVNVSAVAHDLRMVMDRMGRAQLRGAEATELSLYLYELSAVKLQCFVEALARVEREVAGLPEGSALLRRLEPVIRPFHQAKAAISEFRDQVVAHGNPRLGLEHEAVRITRLGSVLTFDCWTFLCRLADTVALLLREPFCAEYVAAERAYAQAFARSRDRAIARIRGTADIAQIDAQIAALAASVRLPGSVG